jgi:hypothetical protein
MPEFDYTPEELDYFESELRQYRLPWISRMWKKYGVPALRYSILPLFVTALTFGIIYNESVQTFDWMWWIVKGIAFLLIFGFGIFALIGHLGERITANNLRKKLGLSHHYFKLLVEAYQITGM